MIFFEHALKRTLRQTFLVVALFLIPISLAFIPQASADSVPMSFTMYGLFILFSAFLLTKQILDDRIQKTVIRIAATPVEHKDYLSGHLLAYLVILVIQNIIFIIMASFLWSNIEMHIGLLALTYMIFSVLSITFTLFWHMLFKSYATSVAVFSVAANVIAIIGGLTLPLSMLPNTIRTIAVILPTYWFSYGIESIYNNNYGLAMIALSIVLGFAIIFLGIGSKRRLE